MGRLGGIELGQDPRILPLTQMVLLQILWLLTMIKKENHIIKEHLIHRHVNN